jgi:sugar phosphate permease
MTKAATNAQAKQGAAVPTGKLRVWIAVFCFAAYMTAFLDRINVSVLIADPVFTNTLGIASDKSKQGLLMSAFLFAYGVSCFLVGPVMQCFGAKKSLAAGLLCWVLLTGVMGAASSIAFVLLCRALLGLGEAVLGPGVSKLVQTWFPVHERAKANGAWYVGLQSAYILGTPLLAWWIAAAGWRGSYYILALFGLVPFVMCLYFVYDHPSQHPRMTREEAAYITPQNSFTAPSAQAAKLDLGFLKRGTFWNLVIIYSIGNAAYWGLVFWIPSYLKLTLGFSWAAMGSLAMLPYICGMLSVMTFMPLMDRFNRRALFTFVGSGIFALLIVVAMRIGSPLGAVAVLSLAFAAGAPGAPALFTMLQNVTGKEQVVTATGLFNGFAYVAASLIPYAIGILYNLTGSLKTCFYFLAALPALTFLLYIPLVRRRL